MNEIQIFKIDNIVAISLKNGFLKMIVAMIGMMIETSNAKTLMIAMTESGKEMIETVADIAGKTVETTVEMNVAVIDKIVAEDVASVLDGSIVKLNFGGQTDCQTT